MRIELDTEPSDADWQAIRQGVREHNLANGPTHNPVGGRQTFHVVARDETGELVGGLRASCYWDTLHIDLLWVDKPMRGSGMAGAMLSVAENRARDLHCGMALVETASWQARPFYEKNGFKVAVTIEGRPRGSASYFLTKILNGRETA